MRQEPTRSHPAGGEANTAGPIVLIGFGEAGNAFAEGWRTSLAGRLHAYDIKTDATDTAPAMIRRMRAAGVQPGGSPRDVLTGAGPGLVFSLVSADRAIEAATQCADYLPRGSFWFDCNSCAPHTKREAATPVEAAGAHYVDVAVMAPVYPRRHETPLLIAGPAADEALTRLTALGMHARIAGESVGRASTIKLMRSVMVKGLEALTAECLLAARKAGVDGDVLASLQASDPGWDWQAKCSYNLERMLAHGRRRGAEMAEAAAMLRHLGCADRLAAATAEWQWSLGELDAGAEAAALDSVQQRADLILSRLD